MQKFDYEQAWRDLALQAYKALPKSVMALLGLTSKKAADLRQDSNCCMIWPEDGGELQREYADLSSEVLANAAHVIYAYGHWRPGKDLAGDAPIPPGTGHGSTWKFAHYADQVLRDRYSIGLGQNRGVGRQIHEGTIRVTYYSDHCWTWHEVAPATKDGIVTASAHETTIQQALKNIHPSHINKRDQAANLAFEKIKQVVPWPGWDTSAYMMQESSLELRRAQRMPKPDKENLLTKLDSDLKEELAEFIRNKTIEHSANRWLVEHDLPFDNVIYCDHTGRFCFGWSNPYSDAAVRAELISKLEGFPYTYDVQEKKTY